MSESFRQGITLATMQPETRVQNGQRRLCRKLILKTLGIIRRLLIFRLEPSKYNRAVDAFWCIKKLFDSVQKSQPYPRLTTGKTSLKLYNHPCCNKFHFGTSLFDRWEIFPGEPVF